MNSDVGPWQAEVLPSFDALRPHLCALRASERDADFYATWPWFEVLAQHGIESDCALRLVLVRHGGAAFCLPLLQRAQNAAAVFGGALTSLSNPYSSLYAPIGDARLMSIESLRTALLELARRFGSADVIDLQPLDAAGAFAATLEAALQAQGYATDRYFCFGNWHLPVAGRSFDAYEPSLPSRVRNTIRRGRKKLDAAGPWSLQVHQAPGAGLESAIADFEAIYSQSWKVPEPFPRFVPELCRSTASAGWLRLGVVRLGEQPIAAQLWIVKDRQALIYKLAYDEAFKRFSAGSVLSAALFQHALDVDHVTDIDYLTGDDDYKRDWMTHRRERIGLVAFRKVSIVGSLSWMRHRLGRLRRRRLQVPSVARGTGQSAP
jgi:CelD/BcsL family acetyltransferase involved in cellulose biosynthesis